MGPPKFGAPGNCPICPPPLKPALLCCYYAALTVCWEQQLINYLLISEIKNYHINECVIDSI